MFCITEARVIRCSYVNAIASVAVNKEIIFGIINTDEAIIKSHSLSTRRLENSLVSILPSSSAVLSCVLVSSPKLSTGTHLVKSLVRVDVKNQFGTTQEIR